MSDTTAFIIFYLIITTGIVLHIRGDRRWSPFPTWIQAIVTALKYQVYFAIAYIGISLFFEAFTTILSQSANFNL